MAHEIHLKNNKYRQWVKAGLGLGYLKEGLAPFCDDIGKQQHNDIINQIQQTKTPQPNVPCGTCQITTLQPDHVRVSKGICPLKQDKCNCCFPNNKRPCPNNVCGAIYDSIIQYHASIPPAPFWKNSDVQQWSTEPWEVCKCFINAPGYKDKTSAVDTDCTGLLHVIINNKYFHSHIGCNVTGPNNLFSKVRQYRNEIFHSSNMELEESKANCYIDDMIAVLQDGKELLYRQDAQQAVGKLQDLKQKDFYVTTECSEEILKQIKDEMTKMREFTENAATKEDYEELKNKFIELERQLSQEREGQLEAGKEQKRKFTEFEAVITEQKQEIKRRKVEDSPQQKKFQYEKAKSERRKKLIEHYHKTLLQVPTSPLQPKSEKCSFNEIYIRPKITREIKGEKGETNEVRVKTMSEIFTKEGVPQKSVYVLGDAGSGKTSFCKYLVNCWCLAHSEEHEADNEDGNENEEGNGKPEGDSETHGGDGEKHGAGNENEGGSSKPEGDSEKHGGDDEKYGGVNENEDGNSKPEGDSERHEGDGEKREAGVVNDNEGGTEKQGGDLEEHEKKGSDIVNEEVKGTHSGDIGNEEGSKTHGGVNEKGGEKHVGGIKKNESDSDDSDGDLIHSESDSDDSDTDLTDSEFDSDDSEYDSKNYELKFNGVKEMKKFDFVFYIPLRQYQNIDTIDEMLQKRYQMKMLNTLLEEESSRVMILLDGLDEWSSENVPEHSIFKEYTILTTSRPWKFHTLRSNDVEIDQSLKLKGFDFRCEWEMVNRTVSQLNVNRHANKEARDCRKKLKEKSLKSLKQVPIMLQQLICLWFDGKLDKTSRCAIYTGMLELFFTWNDMKTTGTSTRLMKGTQKVDLPKYLADKTKLRLNRHFIYEVSQLAYETLFNCPKDKSLTFDICMFDELEISDEVRENCLKLGILTEDECPSLSVSEPPSSLFSFIHKSMQEFLAAVNICINFNAKIGLSDSTGNVELAKKFINEVFQKCSTVNDILEQSNVIIMLSGLEPRLATHVSKYIYDTVSEDSRVQEYRRTISSDIYEDHSCITDIQKLMFESMEELNAACSIGSNPVFYIGDLVIDIRNQYCDIVCSGIDQHQIVPDSVRSIRVDYINTQNVKFTKYLPMFHHLESIKITYDESQMLDTQNDSPQSNEQMINEVNNNCVCETIKVNTSTLKSLSLSSVSNTDEYYPVYKTVVSYLPSMINLVTISMYNIKMSHDDTTTFCNFLERTSHLEQIHLHHVKCECRKQHDVNLSKHQQLQYLDLYDTVSVIDADTTNLEIFTFNELKDSNYEKIFDIIRKSYKLKELELYGDDNNKSQLYHTNITKRLVTVLPLLHNLSKLELQYCRLTDNIIQLPLEMKSLKNIKLYYVIMSLTTWQKFVDSLPGIPHTVDVSVRNCYITGDGEEFNDDRLTLISQGLRGGKGNDAIQYVKDQDQLFHVKRDDDDWFDFSTKK
ncbi:uncharacterized protein LOC132749548 [Ruditapes philippinarum]|uniref:uncharacterized protein LOC132749548 n=1 Tax=Ruditapes philippinarum TaxID=129788 RepID=UPI00295BFD18|nr:uncharacterized protein LOC132749548 [Ruditapes philippinarum]